MIPSGHIYGVALNDRLERDRLAAAFQEKPYGAPPRAPVVYMKPAAALARGPVRVAAGTQLVAAPTIALLFARDASHVTADQVQVHLGAAALALDLSLSLSQTSYYRPAIAQKNGDDFLILGDAGAADLPDAIRTFVDGVPVHAWSLERVWLPVAELVAELSTFMTLRAGDILLIGLPGDAPAVAPGQTIRVEADGLACIETIILEAVA
ncbi:fumarylacetoacetate hydrolase family protein [Sphingobium sp. CAP-1]|uniref:fumarylacetoacetate hydrolase family protein n=1 Tax=Sphingobium sp. CAP-1 TaxID=2676077 RepID=UPI0012BB2093|nr:fumarylacetoacetate hydrolase family protein [Sphingobium sp. CAP-1]QGP80417.1 5-oxopent-3-ene-1,2,5-tricarboxylate decarboxylase [Sphingobium sp. CAP-1]